MARLASASADWTVATSDGSTFTLVLGERGLAVGDGGRLVLASRPGAFRFEPAEGCARFPEIETGVTGEPSRGRTPYAEVRGFLDPHAHTMTFEFIGGSIRCGRPWHRYGVAHALVDCADHEPKGEGAAAEHVLSGNPKQHDTTGWPTFRDWPAPRSLTHEQVYWKWLERSWRSGLRLYVNLLTDNAVLCEVYPLKRNSCDEMDNVRLQARRVFELQDYIDAQYGGPGRGWFRVVRDPLEARRVINGGKLAVVLGIETSRVFGCRVYNDVPACDESDIDTQLAEVHDMGVRQMELINKFDNALGGVAGDPGTFGVATNAGNRYETGRFLQMLTCTGAGRDVAHDHTQTGAGPAEGDPVGGALQLFLPPGAAPAYPPAPHCNARGLSALGEHLVRGMMGRGMVVDPDHLSVLARNQTLSLLEAADYSGVVSSHSWSTFDAIPRIFRLGGVVAPIAKGGVRQVPFEEEWRRNRAVRDTRYHPGVGYGSDVNGFAPQPPARPGAAENPVRYPFRSFDGAVTIDRQRSGERVYDVNVDGVSHYGLYPDWIEDLRNVAGDEIVDDLANGAEAYLQMWERATGIPAPSCRSARGAFGPRGLARVRLGATPAAVLREAGQPDGRVGRSWEWCVQGDRNRRSEVTVAFTRRGRAGLIATTARGHRADRVEVGSRVGRRVRRARPFGPGVRIARAGRGATYVYRVRRGRVRAIALASRSVARRPSTLRRYLRLAGVR